MSTDNLPATIAPAKPGDLIIPISRVGWLSAAGEHICTSLDMTLQADKRLLYRHLQGECETKDTFINKELRVVHVTNHPAHGVDPDTGEEHNYRRTVLQLDDGTLIAFGSGGIDKSIALLQALEGSAPWPKGIRVILKQTKTKSGGIWLWLDNQEGIDQIPNKHAKPK